MTDAPQTVVIYDGLQIEGAREKIVVRLTAPIKRGVGWCLRDAGFRKTSDTTWETPASPQAIFAAQSLANTFYGEPKQ